MNEQKKKSRWRWLGYTLLVGLLLLVALVLLAPTILVSLTYPTITVDLAPYMSENTRSLFSNRTARINFGIQRTHDGYDIRAGGVLLDWPFSSQIYLAPTFHFLHVDVTGSADCWLDNTDWSLHANFEASSSGEWHVDIDAPENRVEEDDPVVGPILSRLPMPALSNLVFSGSFGLTAEAGRSKLLPVTKWTASARLKGFNATFQANGLPIEIQNLNMGAGATGIANHTDIRPMFPHADTLSIAGCVLTNAFASIRPTETAYLVTEAGADCCGGELKMYSFFLDPKKLNGGVTLFVDGADAGEVLKLMKGFRGEASGRLYGKLPLYLKDGNELKIRNAYLHSVPGDVGTLRVFDSKPIMENLALGGVSEDVRSNLTKALASLDYSVLKLNLKPEADGGMALTVKIAGSATHAGKTVPVSFEVTFHGDIEQLINLGLRTATRK